MRNLLNNLYPYFKQLITKFALKRILGAAAGGVQGLILNIIIDKLFKEYVKPGYYWVTRKISSFFKRREVKEKIDAIKNAKTEKEFDDSVDDL